MSDCEQSRIISFDADFNGIAVNSRGVSVSIPGALPGETVRYHIEHMSPHAPRAWGRCDALIESSRERVKSRCPVSWPTAGMCAGCPLMHMSDDLQAEAKKQSVLDCLQNAGLRYIRDFTYHSAEKTLRYRNRTDLVAAEIHGKFVLGSYKPRSHEIIETKNCIILRSPLNQVIAFIVGLARRKHISAARPGCCIGGALRYVSLFANENGKVLVDLICRSADGRKPDWIDSFAAAMKQFSAIAGVTWSINDSPHNALRIAPAVPVWGEQRIVEHHGKIASLFAASGFTQLNTEVAAAMYGTAREWCEKQPRIVWDLYCGAGAFGRTVAPSEMLFGAEFNAPAIEAAKQVSAGDPFKTRFEVMDLENNWPGHWPTPDLILVDPPRKGLSEKVIGALLDSDVPAIIYMSCNPASFAVNAAAMASKYVISKFEAFDMMPQTRHVECLALLRHI